MSCRFEIRLRRLCLGARLLQSLAEFVESRHEPYLIAAIRLAYEIAQGRALADLLRDVADDRDAKSILYEFLEYLSGDSRFQPKEIFVKPLDRNCNQLGSTLPRRLLTRNQVSLTAPGVRIPLAPPLSL